MSGTEALRSLPLAAVPELGADRPELGADRPELGADRPELGSDRPELERDRLELPDNLNAMLEALGSRPRQGPLRAAIEQLCAWRTLRPAELGALLGMRPDNLTKRHLSAMVNQGWLLRIHPENPNHPEQAYRASQIPLVPFGDRDDDVTR